MMRALRHAALLCFGLCLAMLALPGGAAAQGTLIGSYQTTIGPEDHFNSRGVRLTDPVAILRQDRANFHRFGIRHAGDQFDPWFGTAAEREAMPSLVASGGGLHPTYAQIILNHNPWIVVQVYAIGNRISAIRVEIPG